MSELFIGLISGTSVDSVDAALLDASGDRFEIVRALSTPFSGEMRERILALASAPAVNVDELGQMDALLGRAFGQAANALIEAARVERSDIRAIGSHGQTIRHSPSLEQPFTMQIGDPNQILQLTGITTVADFRRRDMALGGQGAPLVPGFHQAAFALPGEARVLVNVGGIANMTVLTADGSVSGFDTGPGNVLLDRWISACRGLPMDEAGNWAASGSVDADLLQALSGDPYFSAPPPKSTGPEYFNLDWLQAHAAGSGTGGADMQATLAELTASSIAAAISSYAPDARLVLLCGGGSHNHDLLARLARKLPGRQISPTSLLGIDPDFVEAAAFAWLARQALAGQPGNVPQATGARAAAVLGAIYPA